MGDNFKEIRVDPCSRSQLAAHPPLDGRSKDPGVAGVEGTHCAQGDGVRGISFEGDGVRGRGALNGVVGDGFQDGRGVLGISVVGEGVRGESRSRTIAAVVGVARYKEGEELRRGNAPSPGIWGSSSHGVGVHGETHSSHFAAVEGIQLNGTSPGPGVYGEHKGSGAAGFFRSDSGEGLRAETDSPTFAAVAGIQSGAGAAIYGENNAGGAAGFFRSGSGGGLYSESNSPSFAAVTGVQSGAGAAIFGENKGTGPAAYFKGTVLVTDDVQLVNADCAEDFDVAGTVDIDCGTVVTLSDEGGVEPSLAAYDRRVAGIVSGAGNYRPAIVLDKQADSAGRRVPVALLGKVWCKVDARSAAIAVGDLLTTSATPGHAMKADDPVRAFGAVIGKALRAMPGGTGLIPVLVTLQ